MGFGAFAESGTLLSRAATAVAAAASVPNSSSYTSTSPVACSCCCSYYYCSGGFVLVVKYGRVRGSASTIKSSIYECIRLLPSITIGLLLRWIHYCRGF